MHIFIHKTCCNSFSGVRKLGYRTFSLCRMFIRQKNKNEEIKEATLHISNNFQYSNTQSFAESVPSHKMNEIAENITDNKKYSTNYFTISEDLIEQEKNYQLYPLIKMRTANKLKINIQGEIIYGVHPVYLALHSKRRDIFQLYMYKKLSRSFNDLKQKIHQQAMDLGIPIKEVNRNTLSQISEGHVHQGICLDASKLKMQNIEEVSTENTPTDHNFCLLLDRIQDPMNFGAVLRSSYYFGVNKVFAVKESSCKLSPVVSKASSGAMEILPVYAVNDLPTFLESKKEKGWRIIGSDTHSSSLHDIKYVGIDEIEVTKPTIFILGNEGTGMSNNIHDLCDKIVTIKPKKDLYPDIGSLNVSVVCGIVLHHLLGRQVS